MRGRRRGLAGGYAGEARRTFVVDDFCAEACRADVFGVLNALRFVLSFVIFQALFMYCYFILQYCA